MKNTVFLGHLILGLPICIVFTPGKGQMCGRHLGAITALQVTPGLGARTQDGFLKGDDPELRLGVGMI